ncbi:unnamed protein product [Orchesella dallaii]|uniref:Chitin-binding type-2 domain-containing protein n=1 Tax=Orchesella dallaii TaxID=48710 RepID=A0ABP1PMM4_9HEXA
MVSIKCYLSVALQLIVMVTFINSKALGRNVVNTVCPISRQAEDSTWLLYGMPPKCYVAGSQGPCNFNQFLLPMSQNSNHGHCVSSHGTTSNLNSGDRHGHKETDIGQKLRTHKRIKRQYVQRPRYGNIVCPAGYACRVGNSIPRNRCRDGYIWSERRQQCIPSRG